MLNNVLYIFIWVLVPIAPAFVLFKFLKNAGAVSGRGPANGFRWSLRGAFGGYVFVFLAIAPAIYKAITPPLVEKWKTLTVEGRVKIVGANPDPRLVRFMFMPPIPFVDPTTGKFVIRFQIPSEPDETFFDPYLIVSGDNLRVIGIPLMESNQSQGYQQTDYQIERKSDGKRILINREIVLNEVTRS